MAYLIYVTDAGRFRFDNKGVSRNASMSLKFKENLLRLSILVREFNIPLIYGKIGGEYIKCKEPAKYNIHHSYRTVFTHFRYRFGRAIWNCNQQTERNMTSNSTPDHIGPARLSKASLLVDRIDQIEKNYIKSHQCVPWVRDGKMTYSYNAKPIIYLNWHIRTYQESFQSTQLKSYTTAQYFLMMQQLEVPYTSSARNPTCQQHSKIQCIGGSWTKIKEWKWPEWMEREIIPSL